MTDEIRNTTARIRDDAAGIFEEALVTGDPGFPIIAQEAQGAVEMAMTTRLPTKVQFGTRAEFEALGVTFGDPVKGDPMFCEARLPEGWTRRESGHSLWTYLDDADGFERASIFYKAAFYDREAFLSLVGVPETRAQDEAAERFTEALHGTDRGVHSPWDFPLRSVVGDGPTGPVRYEWRHRPTLKGDDAPSYRFRDRRRVVVIEPDGTAGDVTEEPIEPMLDTTGR